LKGQDSTGLINTSLVIAGESLACFVGEFLDPGLEIRSLMLFFQVKNYSTRSSSQSLVKMLCSFPDDPINSNEPS
jgi:hypothetical protein